VISSDLAVNRTRNVLSIVLKNLLGGEKYLKQVCTKVSEKTFSVLRLNFMSKNI